MSDYSAHSGRGGSNRVFTASQLPMRRSPRNQRDLGLANQATRHMLRRTSAERINEGHASTKTLQIFDLVRSMAWNLRTSSSLGLSVKQMKVVIDILGLDAPPPLPDPVRAECKVLPLKPPSRDGAA